MGISYFLLLQKVLDKFELKNKQIQHKIIKT